MKSINRINPIVAIILTLVVIALAVVFFATKHIFWGVVFALIGIDFLADAILSLKKA